jgi:hypothetical protein
LPGTDLLVTGPAGRRSEFFGVEVGPAIFMLSLYAAGAGATRMRLSVVGGLGNPFDPLGVGNRPFSRLLNIHPQAPAIEVLTATDGGTPSLLGRLDPTSAAGHPRLDLPMDAISRFRILLREARSGATLLDSGERHKAGGTLLLLAPAAARSSRLALWAAESSLHVSRLAVASA